jgi:S1-C subfamily serine protease
LNTPLKIVLNLVFFIAILLSTLVPSKINITENVMINKVSNTETISLDKAASSIVLIVETKTIGGEKKVISSATGFAVKSNKHGTMILTNKHVCTHEYDLFVKRTNPMQYMDETSADVVDGTLRLVAVSDVGDLCLAYTSIILPAIKMDLSYELKSFDPLYIVGCPMAYCLVRTDGYFSGYLTQEQIRFKEMKSPDVVMFSFSGEVYPGNSGSPVFNANGKVVGILFANIEVPTGPLSSHPIYGIAVGGSTIHSFLKASGL